MESLTDCREDLRERGRVGGWMKKIASRGQNLVLNAYILANIVLIMEHIPINKCLIKLSQKITHRSDVLTNDIRQ